PIHPPHPHSFPTRRSSDLLEPSRDVNQDMRPDLMLTKSDGSLWYAPGRASGRFGGPIKIMNSGWEWRRLPIMAGDMMGNRYDELDRKSTRLNSSHVSNSYA